MAEGPSLAELGEWELIRRLGAFAPPGQFGDDAAILCPAGGSPWVVNTDVLVEGVHFSDATTDPEDVGWRAAVANLSDLAAMGCTEVVGLTVGLVAPGSTPWPWVERVYGGLHQALQAYGGVILGGDCSRGSQRLLAITAIGQLGTAAHAGPIRRGDGRPGDQLVSSGPHGLSRLGLALLQDPDRGLATLLDGALRERAIRAHRRPRARLDAVRALSASRPGPSPWRVAGCDSSDGLVAAVTTLATASNCGASLNRGALPLDPSMATLAEAEDWCLGGGEDFELVVALEPAWAQALVATLPGSGVIGSLDEGPGGHLHWSDGDRITVSGYCHFG